MRCDDVRLVLSARLDGEAAYDASPLTGRPQVGNFAGRPQVGISAADAGPDAVSAHLDGCAMCRTWLSGAERVTRLVRVQAVQVPDLTMSIMQAVHADGSMPGAAG